MDSNTERIKRLAGGITFLLVFFLLSRTPLDADLWWHLRAGQTMWAQKTILLADPFSYTRAGASWVNAFWLSELLFYGLQRVGGYFAIAAFVALTGSMTFYAIYRRLPGNPLANSFIIILAAMTAAPIWGPRPQILSFLFVALLDGHLNNGIRRKWLLVPFFALWANVHGGWIWGFLLLGAHAAGVFVKSLTTQGEERATVRREAATLLGWSALSALAVGLNPNGLAIWKLPFQQVNVSMQIQEWLSPDFHRLDFQPLLWMILLLLLTAPFAAKRPNWPQLFKTLGFLYLTFIAQRNIALFAIVAAPLLAEWANAALQEQWHGKNSVQRQQIQPSLAAALNGVILLSLGAVALGNVFLLSQPGRVDQNYPAAAVEWIKENRPAGRLFNSYNWGGYLLWALPQYPVFIDGRADLYGNEMLGQWWDVAGARPDALSILNRWGVNTILIEPGQPIIGLLKTQGWRVSYEDEQAVILER